MKKSAANVAIMFAIETHQGLNFLRHWHQQDFDIIRQQWPDAPDGVFVGVDPNYKALVMTTAEIGEYMLGSGRFHTAATLSLELGIPISDVTGKLFNIQNGKKYKTLQKGTPVRTKVIDILDGRKSQRLWNKVLGGAWGGG